MSLHCLFQIHSKTELMYLKRQASAGLSISYLFWKTECIFLLMVLIYPLLPVKPMGTEEVLQQVSCDGCTDTVTCQMYERILSSGRTTKNYLRRMSFRCPCGRHIVRKKFISRGIDRGGVNKRKPRKRKSWMAPQSMTFSSGEHQKRTG